MQQEPVVDLLDRAGRLRRLAFSLAVGIAIGLLVGSIFYGFSEPNTAGYNYRRNVRPWSTIFYMAGFAGAVSFSISLAALTWRARRIERANRIPRARVV